MNSEGKAINTLVSDGGSQHIRNGGIASGTIVNQSGYVNISSGAMLRAPLLTVEEHREFSDGYASGNNT